MRLFFIISLWFFSFQLWGQVNNYDVGDIVDNFTVTDINGNSHTLYNLTSQGKYVYLDFFYAACASCQSKISIFNEFWDKYGCGANEIFCIAIDRGVDNDAAVAAFEDQYGGNTNHAPAIGSEGGAGEITTIFGVNAFSTFCLIAPDNKLINKNIHPVNAVKHLENVFPDGFNPQPENCTATVYETSLGRYPFIFLDKDNCLTIEFSQAVKYDIYVFDLSGKSIYKDVLNQKKFKLYHSNFNPGIYFVKLRYKNHTIVRKISAY